MSLIVSMLTVLFGLATVLLYGYAKRGSQAARAGATFCAIAAMLLTVCRFLPGGGGVKNEEDWKSFDYYQKVLGSYVGREVAQRHEGKRAVILLPPGPQGPYSYDPGSAALVTRMGEALVAGGMTFETAQLPISPDLAARLERMAQSSDDPGSIQMGLSITLSTVISQFDTERMNRVFGDLGENAQVVISTVSLPQGLNSMQLLPKAEGPALVLLGTPVSDPAAAIERSILDVLVIRKTGKDAWRPGASSPKQLDKAFERWFMWVTADNLETLAPQDPGA